MGGWWCVGKCNRGWWTMALTLVVRGGMPGYCPDRPPGGAGQVRTGGRRLHTVADHHTTPQLTGSDMAQLAWRTEESGASMEDFTTCMTGILNAHHLCILFPQMSGCQD